MVGLVEKKEHATTLSFKSPGDLIYVLGPQPTNVNCSVYVREILGHRLTPVPEFHLDTEYQLHLLITDLIHQSLLESAHDVSEGGLFTTLLESAVPMRLGFEISLPDTERKDVLLFSESQSRIVISVSSENFKTVEERLDKQGIPFVRLGTVRPHTMVISGVDFGELSKWEEIYMNQLSHILES